MGEAVAGLPGDAWSSQPAQGEVGSGWYGGRFGLGNGCGAAEEQREQGRCEEGAQDDYDHHDGEDLIRNNAQGAAGRGEDQTDLAARDHAQADDHPIDGAGDQAGDHLAREGDDRDAKRDHQRAWIEQSFQAHAHACLLYTSPSPRDRTRSRMPSSA